MIIVKRSQSMLNVDPGNPVVREHPLNIGMIGWWLALPFNTSTNKLNDLGGKWHATASTPIPIVGTARPGGYSAQHFTWSASPTPYYTIPDISGQFPGNEGTVAVWVKRRDSVPSTTSKGVLGWLGLPASVGTETFYTYADGNTYLGWLDTGRPITTAVANRTNWNHFVVVTKAGTNNYKLYINGVQKAQATRTGFGITPTPNFGGGRVNGPVSHDGWAEDWRIWNRGFSAADVKALYFESMAGYPNALRRTPLLVGRATSTTVSLSGIDNWRWTEQLGLLAASLGAGDRAAHSDSLASIAAQSQSRDAFAGFEGNSLTGLQARGDAFVGTDGSSLIGSPGAGDAHRFADVLGPLAAEAGHGDGFGVGESVGIAASLQDEDAWGFSDAGSLLIESVSTDTFRFADSQTLALLISAIDSWAWADAGVQSLGVSSVDIVAMDSWWFNDGIKTVEVPAGVTIIDDFTQTAGTALDGYSKWTIHPSVASGNSDIAIDSTGGRTRGNRSGISIYYSTAVPGSADQAVEWDVISVAEVTVGTMIHGFGLRCAIAADTAYYGILYRNLLSGVTEWRIIKRVTGTETILAQTTATFSVGVVYHMAFSVTGTSLVLSVNGVQVATATDATISATGRYSIYMDPIDTISTRDGRLDNFAASGSGTVTRGRINPEVIQPIAMDVFYDYESIGRLVNALGAADGFNLYDSSATTALIAQRDAWTLRDVGVLDLSTSIIIAMDRFGWTDGRAAIGAELSDGDAAGFSDELGLLSASLGDGDAFGFADQQGPVALYIVSMDAFGMFEKLAPLAADVTDSEVIGAPEAAGILGSFVGMDSFGMGQGEGLNIFLPPVFLAGGDSARAYEGAAIAATLASVDIHRVRDVGSVAAAVGAGDVFRWWDTAIQAVAAVGIFAMDSIGFSEARDDVRASLLDMDAWTWDETLVLAVSVTAIDTFQFTDTALYSRDVVAVDWFGVWDAGKRTEYIGDFIYTIFSNDGAGGPINYDSPIDETTDLEWTSPPLAAPGDYWFAVRVTAIETTLQEKNNDAAVRIIVDAGGADVSARPDPPSSLRAQPLAGGVIRVEWTHKFAYGASNIRRRPTGFRLYRGTVSIDYGTVIATVPYGSGGIAGTFSKTVGPLTSGVAYKFGVRAYNASAEEANTMETTATADSVAPPAPSNLTGGLTSEA